MKTIKIADPVHLRLWCVKSKLAYRTGHVKSFSQIIDDAITEAYDVSQ